MRTDPGLQPTRDVRERISRDLGNDPRRILEYYMEYQRRFGARLRRPPDGKRAAEQGDADGRPLRGRR